MEQEKLTFEQAMNTLDEIVKKLEKGDASLEESLELFEKGTMLIKDCTKLLDAAEQKVVKMQKGQSGEPVELDFETVE